ERDDPTRTVLSQRAEESADSGVHGTGGPGGIAVARAGQALEERPAADVCAIRRQRSAHPAGGRARRRPDGPAPVAAPKDAAAGAHELRRGGTRNHVPRRVPEAHAVVDCEPMRLRWVAPVHLPRPRSVRWPGRVEDAGCANPLFRVAVRVAAEADAEHDEV